jgi:hypothetical protein
MNIAVFDLETNGTMGSSVLSASSLVFNVEGALLGLFNRFYTPHEPYDSQAAGIHGLTPSRIAALRRQIPAPSHFLEDCPNLFDFWHSLDVAGIVVHNLTYDASFLPEITQGAFKWWCSMRGLTAYCAIPQRSASPASKSQRYKWPKLGEAVDILCNGPRRLEPPAATTRVEDAISDVRPHISLCDCFDLYRIVVRVARHRPELPDFTSRVVTFRAPPEGGATISKVAPRHDQFTRSIMECEQKLRSVI